MPIDPARAKSLFLNAAALTNTRERAAYLEQECGADAELRARVEALLAADQGTNPDDIRTCDVIDQTSTVSPKSEAFNLDPAAPPTKVPAGSSYGASEIIAGRYALLKVIGEGGMGSVYLASQTEPVKRQVALKLIKAGMDSKSVLARFDAERQALALMDHPNIARIFDGGVTDRGQPFFVMELVQGVPLTEYCDAKRLTVDARLLLFVQVCQAVQHAHQKGIIHRDLKPGNVLVTEVDGRPTPKVIDFGVAKATEQKLTDMSFADTGAIVGTPAYMSPEQADPSSMDIDTRTDVYALGVMLYELLTGSPPIDSKQFKRGAILEMLRMVREVEPPRPSTKLSTADALPNIAANRSIEPAKLAKLLHGELDWVAMKALDKDRNRRYESANALALDVQRYLADEVVEARPPSRGYRVKKFVKRNKVQVLAASLVFVSLLAGVIGTSLGMIEANQKTETARQAEGKAADEARRAEFEARTARIAEGKAAIEARRAEVQLRRAEGLVYAGKLSLAQSAFAEGNGAAAVEHLEDCQWNLRGWEHRHLWTRFNSKQTLLGHSNPVYSVAFSPDGKRIVTGSGDKTAKVWDAEKGQELLTLNGHTGPVLAVAWSPDSNRILTGSFRTAKVWDAEKGQELLTLNGHTGQVNSVAWSPDGRRILTGSDDTTAKVWDADKGREVLALKGHTSQVSSVAWSPDGKRVLTGSNDTAVKVWDAEMGQEVLILKGHTRPVSSVAWSPDNRRILTGCQDSTARLWDAEKGQELLALKGHTTTVSSVAWSPDATRILTGSVDNKAKVWDAEKGQELLTLKGHTGPVFSVAWRPSSNRILTGSGDNTAKVWDADRGQEVFTLKGHTGVVSSVSWSPNSQRILTGSYDTTARMWDARKDREIFILKGHTNLVSSVSWSPDGRRILTGSWDKTAKVWDAEMGQEILALKGHTRTVTSVSWSPDSRRILTGSQDSTAKVWDAEKGQEVFALKGHTSTVSSVAWSPDGRHILTGSDDRTAKVWDADKGQEVLTLKGHKGNVSSVAWSPDRNRILTGSLDSTARVWDARTGKDVFALKGHTSPVYSVSWSPDSRRILTGSVDNTAKVWDAEKGQEVLTLKGHTSWLTSVSWSPDGKCILTGSGDNTAKVWDADKGQEVLALKGHTTTVYSLAWSSDGKTVFAWDAIGNVLAWDTATGQPTAVDDPPPRPAPGPAVSPDGQLVAKPDGIRVQLVDVLRKVPDSSPWPFPDASERKAYHTTQAALAEKERQWFAVAFHVGRLLLDDPTNTDLKNRREEALRKHRESKP